MSGTSPAGGSPSLDRPALAEELLRDWDTAADRLHRGELAAEVGGDPELATVLGELATSGFDRHGRLLRFVLRLAPDVDGLHYRGAPLTPAGIAGLAADAVRRGPGSRPVEVVRSLREQEVLGVLDDQTDAAWAGALGRAWEAARQEVGDLIGIQGEPTGSDQAGSRYDADVEVVDAMVLQLLTDPAAPARLRAELQRATSEGPRPAWFQAALAPGARIGRLLAAKVLLPQIQRQMVTGSEDPTAVVAPVVVPADQRPTAATPPVRPADDPAASDPTVQLPVVAATGTGGRSGVAAAAGQPASASATARQPAVPGTPRSGAGPAPADHRGAARWWAGLSAALVAPALALLVAAAGLRWPAATLVGVLVWFLVDRLLSVLADPFLRLVGGWPPTVRGWAVLALPFRLLWALLRGPWRLLGSLILLVLWGVAVDRGLILLQPFLAPWSATVAATTPEAFAARWFVPVAAGGLVWLATRRRLGPAALQRAPALRGGAAVGASLRALPGGLGGLLLLPAALLVWTAAAPAPDAWAPYADHREAISARLPDTEWWSALTDRLGGATDRILDLVPVPGEGAAQEPTRWQVVDASALNVREGPGTDQPVVAQLAAGEVVAGTGEVESVAGATWIELRLDDGRTGWASAGFLEEVPAEE